MLKTDIRTIGWRDPMWTSPDSESSRRPDIDTGHLTPSSAAPGGRRDDCSRLLFIDFTGPAVDCNEDIEASEDEITRRVADLGERVVVNHDHFGRRPELLDRYAAIVQRLTDRH